MFNQPPILAGTPEQQLASVREYLVRMQKQLDQIGTGESIKQAVDQAILSMPDATDEKIKKQASDLKSLIVKTADTVKEYADTITANLSSEYVAISDFGTYKSEMALDMETTAAEVSEKFTSQEAINTEIASYISVLNGQIRRGWIYEPGALSPTLGIVISENITFTGEEQVVDNQTYYEISSGQTFGFYTSKGWQFWINGIKVGYFDSEDSALHLTRIYCNESIQLSDKWILKISGSKILFQPLGD